MISVIITNYNGKAILEQCLPETVSFFERHGIEEIIVSDDCSTDDSVSYLAAMFPTLKVVQTEKNAGFSQTCNTGAMAATNDILLFLNNDMVPKRWDKEAILTRFETNPRLFASCPKIMRMDATQQLINESPSYGYFKGGWFSSVNSEKMLKHVDQNHPFPLLWACGGAMFVRKAQFWALGGFDTVFFNPTYGEDLDLSYRAWKRGWEVCYEPCGECFHLHQSTNKHVFTKQELANTHLTNHYLFMWKNLSDMAFIASHVVTVMIKCCTFQLRDIRAIVRALSRLGTVVNRRFKAQHTLKDRAILHRFAGIVGP